MRVDRRERNNELAGMQTEQVSPSKCCAIDSLPRALRFER
jgi:hypothetical protein